MTDEEMRAIIHHAVDCRLSGVQRDPFLARRVLAKGEIKMKKKIAALPLLAALLLALTLTAAAAEALGVNVFEWFGQRYADLAKDSVLAGTPAPVTDGKTYSAQIVNAYYDGETLLVGYAVSGSGETEPFAPDADALAKMTVCEFPTLALRDGEEDELLQKWNAAKATGEAMGIQRVTVYPSDHTVTGDGVDLPPTMEEPCVGADGVAYVIREYESPLPESARNRDSLTLSIGLYRAVTSWYYDGKTCYVGYGEREELPPMVATVQKTDAENVRFAGEGTYGGIPLTVECRASAVMARLTLHADQPFPALPEDHWYECVLLDEAGNRLPVRNVLDFGEGAEAEVLFDGVGAVPGTLTLYILEAREGDWDQAAALESAQPIPLDVV